MNAKITAFVCKALRRPNDKNDIPKFREGANISREMYKPTSIPIMPQKTEAIMNIRTILLSYLNFCISIWMIGVGVSVFINDFIVV